MSPEDLDRLSQAQLLEQRFCDLPISLEGSVVEARASRVFEELHRRGLDITPSIWLAEEWFNPDGVAGFAIPFYLVHPRLVRLERKLMLEAEGVAEAECLRILRHETGHAIDEAFQLFLTPRYRALFGSPRRPYPTSYAARPSSQDYVVHLNAWYAQAHPVEDFAETFAVWLRPRNVWRRQYKDWPAVQKLEAVDVWMRELAGQPPLLQAGPGEGELRGNTRTMAQHYAEKRAFYGIGSTTRFDRRLRQIFSAPDAAAGGRNRRFPSAVSMMRSIRTPLRNQIARPLGVPAYAVDQVVRQLIQRARALDLRHTRPTADTVADLVRLVSRTTVDIINKGQRLPL